MSRDGSDARLDMLADLLAGEGSERDIETIADSPELSAALADLEAAQSAVLADLARLPQPGVPEGLEDRIAAALLAAGPYEPLALVPVADDPRALKLVEERDSAPVSHVTGHPRGSVVPLRRKSVPAARNPWPLRAAAAVALVTVGGLAFTLLPRGSTDTETAASTEASGADAAPELPTVATGTEATGTVATSNTGADYASTPGLLEASVPTLLGAAPFAAELPVADRTDEESDSAGETSRSSAPEPPPALAFAADPDPVLDRLRRPDELAGCLSALAPPDVQLVPAALDYAAWDGEPALVVLVSTAPDAAQAGYDVFVVGADCQAGADDTLHFERVPA